MGSANARVLAVVGLLAACREDADTKAASPLASAGAPSAVPGVALEVGPLIGFRGEAHDVIALPDGTAVVALSWFRQTDFGAGAMHVEEGGRQSHVVRYDVDGKVRWSTKVELWPSDLAFDGDHTVMVVGETREATTFIAIGVESGGITRSGLTDGYPKLGSFVAGKPLVLSTTKDTHEAVIDDVTTDPPARWPWRVKGGIPIAMAPSFGGGVIVTMSEVDGGGQTTALAIDRRGNELWRTGLCATGYSAPVLGDTDGSSTIVACEPGRILRLGADGFVRSEIPLGGSVRAEQIAHMDGKLVIGGQLLGEITVGTRTFASWDKVEREEKSGHGDAIVLVHDGREIVGVAHGHGLEADQTTGVAVANGAIWMVGEARYSLDFGDGKTVAPDPDGAAVGFVGRVRGK